MIGKMLGFGFDVATLPARLTYRSARAVLAVPADFNVFMRQLRQSSDEVAHEIRAIMEGIDAEMSHTTAHLSPQQKQQAMDLALEAAEQQLGMAAVNVVRALWLGVNSTQSLRDGERRRARDRVNWKDRTGPDTGRRGPVIIEPEE